MTLNFTQNPQIASVKDIQPEEVQNNLDQVQLIDVRESDEFTGPLGHIKGAQLIPLGAFAEGTPQLDKTKPVILICRSGGRSAKASHWAKECGFENTYNLFGGMILWNEKNMPVVEKSIEG